MNKLKNTELCRKCPVYTVTIVIIIINISHNVQINESFYKKKLVI